MVMDIPIFRLQFDDNLRQRFHDGCDRIFESGILTNGPQVRAFEAAFSKICGTRHAIAVSNGTAALEICFRALGVEGKKVLLPTNTFIATAMAIRNAGGLPVPLDIELDGYGIAPDAVEHALRTTGDIAAVIAVHIGGLVSPAMQRIINLCDEYGVPLIEDAAHAQSGSYRGTSAGALGLAGCFSFFPTKVMTCAEGGMITTNDDSFADLCKSVRQFGQDPKKTNVFIRSGSNFKLTEFQGLLGLLECDRLNDRVQRRQYLAELYRHELSGTAWAVQPCPEDIHSTFYKVICASPVPSEEAENYCKINGISLTGEVYRMPLHRQPVFEAEFKNNSFPCADTFCGHHICPPLYPELTDEEVLYVCKTLKAHPAT
ncbi:hypothetical protein GO013_12515 [Pseudodesulfovibrio sp. JC047]|uniref:DegT/DnrJ/EryC1/StrS family aminotransferase n=1 Tax=Pseudodesulfovibrio sp. JC047 TaxID=2683199 RepID=UPI0013D2969D|nr:DegT/DnrJ/EryC1/StrS family aminotransferase [Pseudodesulfovibrio sp. JC047]NDV20234.1 hypothetical protein [Pseudodesulfovibrio sp. JC047]